MATDHRDAHFFRGYIWSVVAATWAFALTKGAATQYAIGGLASEGFAGKLVQVLLVSCSIFAIVLFVALFIAFVPMFLTWWLARQYSISSVWYYVVAGALIGAIFSPIIVAIRPGGFWGPMPDPTYYESLKSFFALLPPSGAIGALVFWWNVGRFVRKPDSMPTGA